jgi:hypothetical protein
MKCLRAIEAMIKTRSYREYGFMMLNEIDIDTLTVDYSVWYYYIKARYYVRNYQETGSISDLEMANDLIDDVFRLGYEYNVSIGNESYYFTRANVKFQLATLTKDSSRKHRLLNKANIITEKGLLHNAESRNFQWLQEQLALVA